MEIGRHPQAILAHELNGEALPAQHGAPLRVRIETKLGFKMVKFLRAIEVVDDDRRVGDGMGGVREDGQLRSRFRRRGDRDGGSLGSRHAGQSRSSPPRFNAWIRYRPLRSE